MRIGAISDTHGSVSAIRRAVIAAGDVDAWLHTGDFVSDARELRRITGLPVYSVRGNCDGGAFSNSVEDIAALSAESFAESSKEYSSEASSFSQRVVTLGGVRIFMCHGHTYNVGMELFSLALRTEELCCDVGVYGHTHVPDLTSYGRILLLNPGSPSRPRRGSAPSFGIIEIENGKVRADIKPIKDV